jgi:DNA-binding MarR family transcriptional regulator
MMATAASKAGCWGDPIMSPHASCAPIVSNLKKVRKGVIITGRRAFFDLQRKANYLKVKISRQSPREGEIASSGYAWCDASRQVHCIMILDSETKAVELPEDHGNELRLWLRLLTCTTLIEGEVRSRLRERFEVTLPRFDMMAQLDRAPEGMTLSDVSKRMMVSNGNVTGLVDRLVESGHLDRRTSDTDRRVQVIRLTKTGRAEFRRMAAEHETWIADLFSELTPKDVRELMRLLAKTKASAQKSAQKREM